MTMEMLFGRLFASEVNSDESANSGYILGTLLATTENPAVVLEEDAFMQYTNGRMEIYQAYFEQLNMTGHDTMSALDARGEAIMHAHNSYLQVAYDFGIPVGILFLIICAVVFVRALGMVYRRDSVDDSVFLTMLIIVGFGVASVFEWAYHIANPLGFVFLLMFAPVVMKRKISK